MLGKDVPHARRTHRSALAVASVSGTRVTAETVDPSDQPKGEVVIENNYVLITDGTAHQHGVVVHVRADGTQTHVITVKGVRR